MNDLYLDLDSDESKSSITNVNHLCDTFINTFEKKLNQHAPFRKLTRKEQKLNKKPWLSKGIIKSIQTRNNLYKMILNNNSPELLDEYRLYRNKSTHVKEQAKKLYYNNQISEAQHNSGLVWKTINDIVTNKNTKSQSITSLKNEEGKLIQNPLLIADTFNEYSSQLGRKMANKLSVPSTTFTATSLIPSSAKSFFLKPISLDEVFHQLKSLNPAKSTKSDSPPIKYIKLAASVIASPLTNLFNRCIETGTYLDAFKTAEVIPVYKSGDKFTCSNFRPISLISPSSKIFEKCIYKQLYHYFTSRDILYKHQHGFRENHSTELAVSQMCDSIIENLENKNTTCAIFLDLAKAFDTVNHQILLSKLYAYGIHGIPFKLMQSYLSNRKQCTVINKVKSSSHGVTRVFFIRVVRLYHVISFLHMSTYRSISADYSQLAL